MFDKLVQKLSFQAESKVRRGEDSQELAVSRQDEVKMHIGPLLDNGLKLGTLLCLLWCTSVIKLLITIFNSGTNYDL